LDRSRRFYRDVRGLAICREFGPPGVPEWCSSLARACSRSAGAWPARPGTGWWSGLRSGMGAPGTPEPVRNREAPGCRPGL